MPVIRMTRRWLAGVEPGPRTAVWRDLDTPGLGLRITPAGAASWVYEYRPRGLGRAGRQVRLTIGALGGFTLDEARDVALAYYQAVRAGKDPRADLRRRAQSPTLRAFAETFMQTYATGLKPETRRDYRALLDRHILPALGPVRVPDLLPDHVLDLVARLGEQRRTTGKALALLHRMLELAERPGRPWGALRAPNSNPCHGIRAGRGRLRERRLDDAELAALWAAIAACEAERSITAAGAGVLRVLMLSGARVSELAGTHRQPDKAARWDRFDQDAGTLVIDDHKSSRQRGRKILALSSEAAAEMARMPRVGPYVFASSRDPRRPIASGADHAWRTVCRAAGVTGAGLHDLRRTAIHVADEMGVPREHTAAAVGHTTVTTTEGYLQGARQHQARRAVEVYATEILRRATLSPAQDESTPPSSA